MQLETLARHRWTLFAAIVFVVVLGLRIALPSPRPVIGGLFVIPIALCAAELGLRAGLAAAVLSSSTVVMWAVISHADLAALDYVTRLAGFMAVGGLVGHLSNQRARAIAEAETVARTDPLTGIANRRAWDEQLAREVARAERDKSRVAVVMLDLDHFKEFNDAHGHQAGDALLRSVTARWRMTLRCSDFLARYAGDEFAMLLPDCPPAYAEAVLGRVQAATAKVCTWSAGIAYRTQSETPESLVARADAALYAAKRAGRNHTVTAPVSAAVPVNRIAGRGEGSLMSLPPTWRHGLE